MTLPLPVRQRVLSATGASALTHAQLIQPLWSEFGHLYRLSLADSRYPSVILKHIDLGATGEHPRGWASRRSFERKLRSYEVECHWYRHYAPNASPRFIDAYFGQQAILLLMEDLRSIGFPVTTMQPTEQQIRASLRWLAQFHAKHLGRSPDGLWHTGGYWHLATRPDELEQMQDQRLQRAAQAIDDQLRACEYQTLIHGDAKVANFCFSVPGDRAAAVDFQYVGGGVGISDVMLFISSAVSPQHCAAQESKLLAAYFTELRQALATYQPQCDAAAVEQAWRALYPTAWADFVRFAKGWCPTHWKINPYSEQLTDQALQTLGD